MHNEPQDLQPAGTAEPEWSFKAEISFILALLAVLAFLVAPIFSR